MLRIIKVKFKSFEFFGRGTILSISLVISKDRDTIRVADRCRSTATFQDEEKAEIRPRRRANELFKIEISRVLFEKKRFN